MNCFLLHTLEIRSLLHWLTPLPTLTTHSTARFRACWTSSRAGTTAILGMERVTLTLKIACWPLLLPRVGESLSATGWENNSSDTKWCNSNMTSSLSQAKRQRLTSQDIIFTFSYSRYTDSAHTSRAVWPYASSFHSREGFPYLDFNVVYKKKKANKKLFAPYIRYRETSLLWS